MLGREKWSCIKHVEEYRLNRATRNMRPFTLTKVAWDVKGWGSMAEALIFQWTWKSHHVTVLWWTGISLCQRAFRYRRGCSERWEETGGAVGLWAIIARYARGALLYWIGCEIWPVWLCSEDGEKRWTPAHARFLPLVEWLWIPFWGLWLCMVRCF